MFDEIAQEIPEQHITLNGFPITIKRLDLVHPQISGNKFFKLKYNFIAAKEQGYSGVITFGGAYSNHIAATAYAANLFGFKSIGYIRGEELATKPLNETLSTAKEFGMQLQFLSRQQYQQKHTVEFIDQLKQQYPDFYIIPEGGTNDFAIQGCKEILTYFDQKNYDVICCAVGTGGTITGIIESSNEQQNILGFSALKGDFLTQEVQSLTAKTNWQITDQFCCGGYAKTSEELLKFIHDFESQHNIPLEHIYTAKMFLGVSKLIQKQYFKPQARILLIHTGGLQGKLASIR